VISVKAMCVGRVQNAEVTRLRVEQLERDGHVDRWRRHIQAIQRMHRNILADQGPFPDPATSRVARYVKRRLARSEEILTGGGGGAGGTRAPQAAARGDEWGGGVVAIRR